MIRGVLRYLLALLLPGCLLGQSMTAIPLPPQQTAPTMTAVAAPPPVIDITQLGSDMSALAATWMARIKAEGIPETESIALLRTEATNSPALAKLPMARKGIQNLCTELIAISEAKAKATQRMKDAVPEKRPLLTTLPPLKWAEAEKEKVRKQWRNRIAESEKTLQKNIALIQRSILSPGGQEFQLPLDDPFLNALHVARMENDLVLNSMQRPNVPLALNCEIQQILGTGCLVLARDSTGQSRQLFIADLIGPDLRVGQVVPLVARWDGLYRYTTPEGKSTMVESWKYMPE